MPRAMFKTCGKNCDTAILFNGKKCSKKANSATCLRQKYGVYWTWTRLRRPTNSASDFEAHMDPLQIQRSLSVAERWMSPLNLEMKFFTGCSPQIQICLQLLLSIPFVTRLNQRTEFSMQSSLTWTVFLVWGKRSISIHYTCSPHDQLSRVAISIPQS